MNERCREVTELPERKPIRWRGYDYGNPGAYFLTICTEKRKNLLSTVVGEGLAPPEIRLRSCGKIAEEQLRLLERRYFDVSVDRYVIMPNHIHVMLFVFDFGASRTSPPTRQHNAVSQFVSTFKRFCNKEYGADIWQRHFNDHIIRDREDYENHIKYICENPLKWRFDELYAEQ